MRKNNKQEQQDRSIGDILLEKSVFWVVRGLYRTITSLALTLSWILVMILAGQVASWMAWLAFFAGLGAIAAGIWWKRSMLRFTPVVGDYMRARDRRAARKAQILGNAWIRDVGLVPDDMDADEVPLYPVRALTDEGRTVVEMDPIRGLPTEKIVATAEAYKDRQDAKSLVSQPMGRGALRLVFYVDDPLDESITLRDVPPLDAEKMSVVCARNRAGEDVSMTFKGQAGLFISGIGGSGKTAGTTTFLTPLATSPDVDMTIIDGKGGSDWGAYKNASSVSDFLPVYDQTTKEKARDILRSVVEDMNQRIQTNKDKLGNSNFWNVSRETRANAGAKFKVVVIDECHELFAGAAIGKEQKAVAEETTQLITTLIKRGRSAGICVILLTQKPTSDAVPTAIRDNCGLKVCFRVETTDVEKAALGSVPDSLDGARASDIPRERVGGAVITTDEGTREAVRFMYMPETVMEEAINNSSSL